MPWLYGAFGIFLAYGLWGGLYFAPADYIQGDAFRIIYIHVPCAFLSLGVYSVMSACAFVGLVWRIKMAFLIMRQSVAIGAGFTLLSLITGSIWGKPMWGTWWIWDARLTSELILLFLYLAILLLQSALYENRHRERLMAIFVLIGSLDIPIIHYSVYWWNTLHQGSSLSLFKKPAIDASMLYPLFAMIFAFTIYYAIILLMRIRYDLIVKQSNPHWLTTQHV